MFLFIATIFIAELIIVWTVISKIVQADKAVKKLQKEVVALKPQLEKALIGARGGIHLVKEKKDSFTPFSPPLIPLLRKELYFHLLNAAY